MSNSILSNFKCRFSKENYRTEISSSILSGECDIKGVKSIDASSVENSSIRGSSTEIRNEMIKNITNYDDFKEQSMEKRVIMNTEELNLL
jgi:hypothetical protein